MSEFPLIPGYRIEKELGQGGMATVYLGVQEKLNRRVAIKVLEPLLLKDKNFAARFVKEAETAANLNHPNIVTIHDVGHDNNSHYMVMEFIAGGSLKDRIHQGALVPQEALQFIRQVASALQYAHDKGYIHRDIKPDNIMFRTDGTAVLTDFGIARAVDSASKMTKTGMSIGTPHYMSPEQIRGLELDGRSDLYSLGILFFEMLTGQVPYDATDTIAIAMKHVQEPVPTLPLPLAPYQPLLEKMMAKDADARYRSAGELLAAIDKFSIGGERPVPVPVPDKKSELAPSEMLPEKKTRAVDPPLWASNPKSKTLSGNPSSDEKKRFPLIFWLASLLAVLFIALFIILNNQKQGQEKELAEFRQRQYAEIARQTEEMRQKQQQDADKTKLTLEQRKGDENSKISTESYGAENLEKNNLLEIKGVVYDFISIPTGEFQMGDYNNGPMHLVKVTGFQIGKTEITQGLWEVVMGNNPSRSQKGVEFPVENVSWNDCHAFIRNLNKMTGKKYRLPTEAEWEYACRAGTTGDRYGDIDSISWYKDNSDMTTHPVGQKKPNAWGLHDMLGNVWEWCSDWYGSYDNGDQIDPVGPSSGSFRINRGGSWNGNAGFECSAFRHWGEPDFRQFNIGFRLAFD